MAISMIFRKITGFLHLKNTNKIVYILMQGKTVDAILSLRTNVAILVNVTSNAHIY